MKKPTLKGWLAIIGAIIAFVIVLVTALKDKELTTDEVKEINTSFSQLTETVQAETADDKPAEVKE